MLRLRALLPALAPVLVVWLATAAYSEDYVAAAPLDHVGLVNFWQFQVPLEAGQSVRDVYLASNRADAEVLLDKTITGCAKTKSTKSDRSATRSHDA